MTQLEPGLINKFDESSKNTMRQIFSNKTTMDAVSLAAANSLRKPMQETFMQTCQQQIIPSFEKSTQTMFQNVKMCFESGTNEYLQSVERLLPDNELLAQFAADGSSAAVGAAVANAGVNNSNEEIEEDLTMLKQSMLSMSYSLNTISMQVENVLKYTSHNNTQSLT